eukprot:scaffold4387_cov400-Prasinococcus_capsulatus_cf.AAC.13
MVPPAPKMCSEALRGCSMRAYSQSVKPSMLPATTGSTDLYVYATSTYRDTDSTLWAHRRAPSTPCRRCRYSSSSCTTCPRSSSAPPSPLDAPHTSRRPCQARTRWSF